MQTDFQPTRENDFFHTSYDYKGRFMSYWHQIDEVVKVSGGGSILEIGPGNRFMTDYLLKRGHQVKTLDIDATHSPDYVGSVTQIPLPARSMDVVACFQVLEHLPFDAFASALREMARVARHRVLFSVPDVRYFLELDASFFSSDKRLHAVLSFPRLTNRTLPTPKPGGHLWEIGRPGYPLSRIRQSVPPILTLRRAYRVPGNAIHHMFVLDVVPTP